MTQSDTPRILFVEDEDRQREALTRRLVRAGFDVTAVGSAEAGLEALATTTFAAMLTDLRLPGIDGIELVRRASAIDEQLPAIIMTAFASLETAVEALRAGAHDYILKPIHFDELGRKLERVIEHRTLVRDNARLRRRLRDVSPESDFIGDSAAAAEVRTWIDRAASVDANVLITGETGTGKEVIARLIHERGPRADRSLVTVNVAALAPNMIESELFGHQRGSFTGAQKDREGLLRTAGRGTVFLDEIGELPMDLQAKLLRVLEAREILPIGSDRPVPFEARVLCATHRDLKKRIADEEFREDLYYRLNVLRIDSPPLRERREDIPALAQHLCERLAARRGSTTSVIPAETMHLLAANPWPGNVRELSNIIERAMIIAADGPLEPWTLPADFEVSKPTASPDGGDEVLDLRAAVAAFERRHIARALRASGGNREGAARALGLSPATLYRRLDRLDLQGDNAESVQ